MKCIEEVAYYLYVQGILTRIEIKTLIREGFIGYLPEYLWNPMEKQLDDLGVATSDRRKTWEYENWEEDYIKRETKIGRELLQVFAARTADAAADNLGPEGSSLRPRVVDVELDTLQKHLRKERDAQGKGFAEVLAALAGGNAGNAGGNAGNVGGNAGNVGGNAGTSGGNAGTSGGNAGNVGGNAGTSGGNAGNVGGNAETAGVDTDISKYGEALARMPFDRFVARLQDLCAGPSKFWKRSWDFLSYDNFLLPHYSGPIVTAFKQILRGLKRNELGQYDWTMRYEEIEWTYHVVQARMLLLRAYAHLLRRAPDFWTRQMQAEYHPLAFCAGALVYSAHRTLRAGHLGPDEALPLAFTVVELAHGKAWACAHHMDANAVMPFLNHFFRFSYERQHQFGQIMLRQLYELFATMDADVEKQDFIDRTRLLLEQEGEHRVEPAICLRQLHALYAHEYFGPLLRGFPPEKEQELMAAWWQGLAYEVGGLGVTWDFDELDWKKNVIDFEAYLENETFQQLADPILRLFYGICVPAAWNR